jgi:hypothetical protein
MTLHDGCETSSSGLLVHIEKREQAVARILSALGKDGDRVCNHASLWRPGLTLGAVGRSVCLCYLASLFKKQKVQGFVARMMFASGGTMEMEHVMLLCYRTPMKRFVMTQRLDTSLLHKAM